MFKCICGKEVKSSSGLKRHQANCSVYQESLDVPEIRDAFAESRDEPETTKEVKAIETIPKVDNSHKSRLGKLKSAYMSSYDAQYRFNIEQEYKSLGGDVKELRK